MPIAYELFVGETFIREAEQGVIGAMLIRPESIDVLDAEVTAEDFY